MKPLVKFIRYVLALFIIQMLAIHFGYAQNTVPQDVQYKKRPTNAIAAIAQGNPDEAIKNLENFLADFPNDGESLYCMAVAYATKNDVPKALDYVGKALESGMPIERFIAGPRDLLKNLVESEVFLEFANARYVKLLHGPMLGDVTPTNAKIWLRTDREANVTVTLLGDGKEQHRKI